MMVRNVLKVVLLGLCGAMVIGCVSCEGAFTKNADDNANNSNNDNANANANANAITHTTTNKNRYTNTHTDANSLDRAPSVVGGDGYGLNGVIGQREDIVFEMNCSDVGAFIDADNSVWDPFLKAQPGFVHKFLTVRHSNPTEPQAKCDVWSSLHWTSLLVWHSINSTVLAEVTGDFNTAFGKPYTFKGAFPTGDGLSLVSMAMSPSGGAGNGGGAIEFNQFAVDCDKLDLFFAVDDKVWTPFLRAQPGFLMKQQLYDPASVASGHCTAFTYVHWESWAQWKAIPAAALNQTESEFKQAFPYTSTLTRVPDSSGLDVVAEVDPSADVVHVVAINGNDVVLYGALPANYKDIQGKPSIQRFVNASDALPAGLLKYHPESYEFWFASNSSAQAFETDPWRYIPAYGGHSVDVIATDTNLTATMVVQGDVAYPCVNTTKWKVFGTPERTFLVSCAGFDEFVKDPTPVIAQADAKWSSWFGSAHGPINDACFQDGYLWDPANPTASFVPAMCGFH